MFVHVSHPALLEIFRARRIRGQGQGTTFSIVLPTCANAEKTGDTKWQAA